MEQLKLDSIPLSRTPWPQLTLKTSDGDVKPLLGLASGYVEVMGIEVAFYACIIDPKYSNDTDYDLLLGIPWLAGVKGIHDVSKAQVSITCPNTKKQAVVKGPEFRPIDFRRLFLEVGGRHGQLNEERIMKEDIWGSEETSDTESDEDDDDDETSDEEDSEDEDDEELPGPQNSPTANSAIQCRSALLELPTLMGKPKEMRYIEAKDYLKLYGKNAPYSHLAKKMTELPEDLRHGPDGEAILIADHDGKSFRRETKSNFLTSARTVN